MSNIEYKGVAHVSFVGYDFYQWGYYWELGSLGDWFLVTLRKPAKFSLPLLQVFQT